LDLCWIHKPRNRKRKPRKDDAKAVCDLADTEATRAKEAAMREAIAKSLADLVPVNNSMPMDATLAWSRQDLERKQAEQQRWPALPARGASVVKLEDSSDDDLYRPTPPRFGQGSSRWTPGQSSHQAPPQDDGGDSSDTRAGDAL
jgi:hypothetical protein